MAEMKNLVSMLRLTLKNPVIIKMIVMKKGLE